MMANLKLSVIVPLRNTKAYHREMRRLDTCIRSLDSQTVAGDIEIIVPDIDSDPYYKAKHKEICKRYKHVKYIYTKTGKPWNISLARNIGIRAAKGDYVMCIDVDCFFTPTFIETFLNTAAPDKIFHCRVWELPKDMGGGAAYDDTWKNLDKLKTASTLRPSYGYGSCQAVSRDWAVRVHGYDEKYVEWGADDTDFYERAIADKLQPVWLENQATYFHQWHPDSENKCSDYTTRNRARLILTQDRSLPVVRNPHEWGMKGIASEWDDTVILLTTFLRDESLLQTIKSVRKYYPTIDMIVADNGHPTDQKTALMDTYDIRYVQVPFDSGVTTTRNAGMKVIGDNYKYVVIIEDDIGFMEETDLKKWRNILDIEPEVGVVGGHLIRPAGTYSLAHQYYEAELEIKDNTSYIRKIENPEWKERNNIKYHFADMVLNVFMMRREVWETAKWDENIKSAPEHDDWFLTLKYKTHWKVVYVPDVILYHRKDYIMGQDDNYLTYRMREKSYEYFAQKWGIEWLWSSWHLKWGYDNPMNLKSQAISDTKSRRHALTGVVKILNRLKLKWWIEAGTCLGAIRDNDFIPHDMDIDIGVWYENPLEISDKIIEAFVESGFALYKKWEYEGRPIELSFDKTDKKIDIFFFSERKGLAWHGAFGPAQDTGIGPYNVFLPHVFTLSLFDHLKNITFAGIPVKVPNPPEQYLLERYGEGWKTPDKNYRYWLHCQAIDRNFFSDNATIYIGGVWDLFHIGHLNILENAKKLGRKLIVGVLTDEAAGTYKELPVIPFGERKKIIESLKSVDMVITQNDKDPTGDWEKLNIKPHYVVHGDDWGSCPGQDYVRENGGRPIFFPYTKGVSTTEIKKRINVPKPIVKSSLDSVAICIKTFLRDDILYRTLDLLKSNIPCSYKLYIADDGTKSDRKKYEYEKLQAAGHEIIELPFNTGISFGRNAIIQKVQEDYILLLDDDEVLTDKKSLQKMKTVLDSREDIGLVAAVLKQETGGFFANENYAKGLTLDLQDGLLMRRPAHGNILNADGVLYRIVDQVPNIFLAKKEIFKDIKWDNRIKVEYEHIDFFLELKKTKWKAAICLNAEATHLKSDPDGEYYHYRRSAPEVYFLQKHNLKRIINQF